MTKTRKIPLVLVMLLTLVLSMSVAACGGDSPTEPEPDPTVSGSWSGTSQGLTLNLVLTEGVGGTVSGSGNVSGPDGNIALTVRQGTHTYPNLSLILGATGFEDMNFSGRLTSETTISGTLNGSGFDDFDFNLVKG